MIRKKVCMIGAFAVGKTSLVSRYVHSLFSEKYLTTIGVKIDKRELQVGGTDVALILWDLYGEDEFQKLRRSYLRGTDGFLLVADGTRPSTFDKALELRDKVIDTVGEVPFVLALNKSDVSERWELPEDRIEALRAEDWDIVRTSAKLDEGVEATFQRLTEKMLSPDG